jgi:hypothetical protein
MQFDCAPLILGVLSKLLNAEESMIRHSIFKLQEHPLQNIRKELYQNVLKHTLEDERKQMIREEQGFIRELMTNKQSGSL